MNPDDQQELNALNEYLDGDISKVDQHGLDLSQVPHDEIVRHLLVAGIVQQLGYDTEGAVRQQVQDGMAAVNQVIRHERRVRIRTGLFGSLIAAAAITVTALLFSWQSSDLRPVIDQMQAYLRADQDRQYSMRAETRDAALNFIEAETTLSVRGNDKFLVSFSGNVFGAQFVVNQGFDGEDYWVVLPSIGLPTPVLVSETSLASCWGADIAVEMQDVGRGIDRLEVGARIFSLVENLERNYEVTASTPESTTFSPQDGQLAITASRHAQTDPDYPMTIEFLLDTSSGTVEQIVVEYMELPAQLRLDNPYRKIRYQLQGEFPRADSVYQHQGHHDGSRQVLRLD